MLKKIGNLSRTRQTMIKFVLGIVFGFVMTIAFHLYPEFWIEFVREQLIDVVIRAILKFLR